MFKEIYRRIMYYITVPKCVFCGEKLDYTDKCFCPDCLDKYNQWKTRNCSRCSRELSFCSCSNAYLGRNGIKTLTKLYRYRSDSDDSPSKRIIFALKELNRSDVFDFLADEVAESINNSYCVNPDKFVVTNVPRRGASIQKYGYDHSAELARRVAKRLGLKYTSALKSIAKKAQKEVSIESRRANAAVKAKKGKRSDVFKKTVIIVDDIVTSGSSMVASAKALRKMGASHTFGATVAIAFGDTDEKRIKK